MDDRHIQIICGAVQEQSGTAEDEPPKVSMAWSIDPPIPPGVDWPISAAQCDSISLQRKRGSGDYTSLRPIAFPYSL